MGSGGAKDRLMGARRDLYREAILDAAERIFAELGYEATKVADITSEAGVSLATFYAVFKKKWDVYRAVHARRLAELMETIGSPRLDGDDVLDAMMRGVETYLTFHMQYPHYLRMHLREGNAWTSDAGLRSPEQAEAWQAGIAMTMTGFEAGIAQGIFLADDTELMARTMLGMHQVRLALWVERGQQGDAAELSREALKQLIRSFCPHDRIEELLSVAGLVDERASA